jgi:hypothetical protein
LHVHRVGEDPGNGELRQVLLSVQERLQAEGVHAGGEVRLARSSGGMATVITRTAAETGVDLGDVGSRGRTHLGGLFLGMRLVIRLPNLSTQTVAGPGAGSSPKRPGGDI